MERAAVVLRLTVLVSYAGQSMSLQLNDLVPYLLGGSCLFPLLLALLRATGSKSLMAASGCACASANDVDSTSGAASVEALRRRKGWMAEAVGRASLHKAFAVRYGSSRRAMMSDVVLGWLDRWRCAVAVVATSWSTFRLAHAGQGWRLCYLPGARVPLPPTFGFQAPDPLPSHLASPTRSCLQSQSQLSAQPARLALLFCG
jgi:hypothetical protein